ncbi:L-threonylcarbamoyladenylate synthase [Candidatus Fonsibacter ubiquis]|uniref:L-threonylcarbamoyladenylate synthase n=1 Tax=Candidatus Fonsibacter ubiquis TaxID=1925548 RepID=UPI000C070754|nr:L-threonylcarbamoyladenylate synthase [Candidatus Fonsibacter ubiquis]
MKNIYSNIYKPTNNNLTKAKIIVDNGGVVAVPTETVYGLAANAYNNKAIQKIYSLKRRPSRNPLIVHFKNIESIKKEAFINKNFLKLVKKFSPGPLTYILKKKKISKISKLANKGLDTIAVRIPKEKNIIKLLSILKYPLAAPSANKSKSLSPTTAKHVAEEFGKSVKMIIDGGVCKIGIESTVIDLTTTPKILREGGLSSKIIEKFLKVKLTEYKSKIVKSPGQIGLHYSPGIPIYMNREKATQGGALIVFGKKNYNNHNIFNLSINGKLKDAAKNFFNILRIIKNKKFESISVNKIPNKDLGKAINERLKRASFYE